ncbi:GH25 family lysozyme [bacterium]|nr:GH25 family lysozyme [bacterium]MDB3907068.1 GH25 family lysozyme [Crocinitomicaceae bacterium]
MARRKITLPRLIAGGTLLGLLAVLAYVVYLQFRTPPHERNEGFRPLATGFNSHGIDVSHYQGDIDWDRLIKKSSVKISFVFCKATEGTSLLDKRWRRNYEELRKRNIPVGAYHYFKPNKDAAEQAHFFLKHYQPNQSDLPPVIDVEEESTSSIKLRNDVKRWMDIVQQKTGRQPIIYTNYFMFSTVFKPHFRNYTFWIANYSDRPERMKDDRIQYWQYTDQGMVPGIDENVDLNMSKVKF